jgi:hypothetical protein
MSIQNTESVTSRKRVANKNGAPTRNSARLRSVGVPMLRSVPAVQSEPTSQHESAAADTLSSLLAGKGELRILLRTCADIVGEDDDFTMFAVDVDQLWFEGFRAVRPRVNERAVLLLPRRTRSEASDTGGLRRTKQPISVSGGDRGKGKRRAHRAAA